MSRKLDFYFDYASPFSYLANTQLSGLVKRTSARIDYRPVLLGALIADSKNTPPPSIPAKMQYLMADVARWTKRYGVPLQMNPHFPINTVRALRAVLVALEDGGFENLHEALFSAMWVSGENVGDADVVVEIASRAGMDGAKLRARMEDPRIKEALKQNTADAVRRGAFGVPTFFVGEEMFFGNDRLDFVEEALLGT